MPSLLAERPDEAVARLEEGAGSAERTATSPPRDWYGGEILPLAFVPPGESAFESVMSWPVPEWPDDGPAHVETEDAPDPPQADDRPQGALAADVLTIQELVAALPPRLQAAVKRTLRESLPTLAHTDDLDPDVWGPPPDPQDALLLSLENAIARTEAEDVFARKALSLEQAAERLGCPVTEVEHLVATGQLVLLETGERGPMLPEWQFTEDGPVPHIDIVWPEYPGDVMAFSSWMTHPDVGLGGDTPRDRLQEGDVQSVLGLVRQMHG